MPTSAIIKKGVISSKSTDLNHKLTTADTDIAALIDPKVLRYIDANKGNNIIVAAKPTTHINGQTCRSFLFQCMAQIEIAGGKLDVATFRQYANSARLIFNSEEVTAVYDALDQLNMSVKSDADLKNCIDSLKAFKLGGTTALYNVLSVSILIMSLKMMVATNRLSQLNKTDEFVAEGKETSMFEMIDCYARFFVGNSAMASVADTYMEIIDKVDVVEQSKKMVRDLNGAMKAGYKDFFNGIKDASNSYKKAMTEKTG